MGGKVNPVAVVQWNLPLLPCPVLRTDRTSSCPHVTFLFYRTIFLVTILSLRLLTPSSYVPINCQLLAPCFVLPMSLDQVLAGSLIFE
jgi:hypothetical protein